MPEVLDVYANYLRAGGASQRTVAARLAGARRLIAAAGGVEALRPEHAIMFIGSVHAAASRATYCQHVRALDRFLQAMESPAAGFAARVPVARFPRGVPRPIDVNELAAALALANFEERVMLHLGAYAGLRVSEIGRVRGDDLQDGCLLVHGKGGVDEMVPLHRVLVEDAERLPAVGYWFPGRRGGLERTAVWKTIRRALDRVGSRATPHQLRHFYGTALLDSGANVRVVQELMRHASLTSTQVYTKVRAVDRRRAIDALPEVGPLTA